MSEHARIVKVETHPKSVLMRKVAALVLENLFADTLPDGVASASQINSHIRWMDPNDSYHAMIDESGQLVAAVLFAHRADTATTQVYQLVVADDRRGQGYGAEMMQHVAGVAAQAGSEKITLLGLQPEFYTKLGFACTGELLDGKPVMEAAIEDILAYDTTHGSRPDRAE